MVFSRTAIRKSGLVRGRRRQAAGPLTEDLPNVFAGNLGVRGVDLTHKAPPLEEYHVVSHRVIFSRPRWSTGC